MFLSKSVGIDFYRKNMRPQNSQYLIKLKSDLSVYTKYLGLTFNNKLFWN